MRRREFITLIGGAAVALPLVARAQQPASARLGVLLYSNPKADPQISAVLRGLTELGFVEGRNINITYRYAEGRPERLPDLAAELVQLKPDVILALGGYRKKRDTVNSNRVPEQRRSAAARARRESGPSGRECDRCHACGG